MKTEIFRKKNFFEKLYLKLTDRKEYKKYKFDLSEQKWNLIINEYLAQHDTCNPFNLLGNFEKLDSLNVLHSGNAGDIIYALPTLKKISQLTSKKVNFYLRLNQPLLIDPQYSHPLGNVMLNSKMVNMLKPLLESQDYIETCEIYTNQSIDINCDNFRKAGIKLDRGDISRWCSYITGINPDLHLPWIETTVDSSYSNCVVIARSERYRNPTIDYRFIAKYENVVFVGVKSEYEDIKRFVPLIKWVEVSNFIELAAIINGCKLFIGNQSFPFSIAEALKIPRILEVYAPSPNVIPQGPNGYDFYFQNHFEWLVKTLN